MITLFAADIFAQLHQIRDEQVAGRAAGAGQAASAGGAGGRQQQAGRLPRAARRPKPARKRHAVSTYNKFSTLGRHHFVYTVRTWITYTYIARVAKRRTFFPVGTVSIKS